jgi:uronate dehydrogenase
MPSSSSSKLSVLLTGAGGRIGPHLLPAFRDAYDLRVLDRRPVPGFPDTVVADLQDADALRGAMGGVDVLVHLAAQADEAPFLDVLVPNNVVGLYNAFEAARAAGVRRIVFASTVQTVGFYPPEHGTIEITDPPRPVTMYGATKVFGETLGRFYHDKHGIEFVGVRIGAFQPYDSAALRDHEGLRDIWLSPRDALGLLRRAVEKPGVGYALVFGTSITPRERLSRAPARELLDFEPEDDVTTLRGVAAGATAGAAEEEASRQ